MDVPPYNHGVSVAPLCGSMRVRVCALERLGSISLTVITRRGLLCAYSCMSAYRHAQMHAPHVACMLIDLWAESYNPPSERVCRRIWTLSAWFSKQFSYTSNQPDWNTIWHRCVQLLIWAFWSDVEATCLYRDMLCWQQSLAGFLRDNIIICRGITWPVLTNLRILNPHSHLLCTWLC